MAAIEEALADEPLLDTPKGMPDAETLAVAQVGAEAVARRFIDEAAE